MCAHAGFFMYGAVRDMVGAIPIRMAVEHFPFSIAIVSRR